MIESIEVSELRAFLTLAEELNFGRTAERLRLTPSRVSQTLWSLEGKLGAQLIHRTTRHVELTAGGQRLNAQLGRAYGELMAVLERSDAADPAPCAPLRIGLFTGPVGASRLAEIVRRYESGPPRRRVQLAEVPIRDPFGPLHRGELDVMATWLPHGQTGLVTGPALAIEPRVLAVGAGHPLAGRSSVSLDDVADHAVLHIAQMPPELREAWVPSTTPDGRRISATRPSADSRDDRGRLTTELAYLVAVGRVVHPTVPSVAAVWGRPDIQYLPIRDMPPLKSALVWRRASHGPSLRAFVRTARDVGAGGGHPWRAGQARLDQLAARERLSLVG